MACEMLIGLQVTDDETYGRYRAGMTPLLEVAGGSFRYDFRVSDVLKSETSEPINRLFVIAFPDARTKDEFFANPEYLAVREEFFGPSVAATTRISEYERPAT